MEANTSYPTNPNQTKQMTDTFTTNAWAFDGSGNNWVEYPKGVNKDGKGLENGLFVGGHTYSAFDKANKYAEAFAAQDYDYVVNNTTDTTGLKAMTGIEVVATRVADNSAPSKEWDAEAVDAAALDQVKTFGSHKAGLRGAIRACDIGAASIKTGKTEKKEAALDKALKIAFTPDITHDDVSWDLVGEIVEEGSDPMEAMIEAEEEANSWESLMAKAKAAMTTDEWALVIAKANGMNQTAIAEEMGVSKMAISKRFRVIAKKAVKATGVAFVA